MNRFKIFCLFVFLFMLVLPAYAKDVEHPLIRPFPGSVLDKNPKFQNFAEYKFWVTDPQSGKAVRKAVRGKFWRLTYRIYDANGKWDGSHSVLEYRENYKQAALEQGGTILYENQGYLTFTLPGENVGTTWCEVHIWNKSQQDISIIEEKGFKKSLTFGPAEMKAALDADGRVKLYGILFDLDKATLKPESTKQLQHVVTLLKENPGLKLEVQGHTDDQGSDEYNMELSQRRAETVVAYLGLFGIDTARLTPKGYGETKPVMSNSTEEGRAKNRRVELVMP
jgi:outer membrane protein OmpA-like peptidoglycan-associated protein